MAKKQTITVKEASGFTGLAERTIQDYCQKDIIDAVKVGNQWKIYRVEFKQWLRSVA